MCMPMWISHSEGETILKCGQMCTWDAGWQSLPLGQTNQDKVYKNWIAVSTWGLDQMGCMVIDYDKDSGTYSQ